MADHDRKGSIEAMCLFFIVLSILVTLLRMISRLKSAAGLWWDDWFSLAALIFVIGLNALGYYETYNGLGQHIRSLDPGNLRFFLHSLYHDAWVYNLAMALVKISVLFFYQRIFATTRKTKRNLWITAGLTAAWFTSMTLVALFECSPIKAAWDFGIKGNCLNRWAFYMGSAVPSIILDFILLCIPVPFLWRLHMGSSQKFALTVTFLLGYLNPVISIVRFAYLIELRPKINDPDIPWNFANLAIWSIVECNVALISACVPSLQFLFLRAINAVPGLALPRLYTTRTKSGSRGVDASAKQGPPHQSGSFARLKDDQAKLGFAGPQNRYEVSVSKKYGMMGEEIELGCQEPTSETAQIMVSRSVDVVSCADDEEQRVGAGYM